MIEISKNYQNWIIETEEKNGNGRKQYRLNPQLPYICQEIGCGKEKYWSIAGDYFLKKKEVKECLENDYCLSFFAYGECRQKRFLAQPLCYRHCSQDCKSVVKTKEILEKAKIEKKCYTNKK